MKPSHTILDDHSRVIDTRRKGHVAKVFSTAQNQTTDSAIRTRWTPVAFGVICLVGEIKRAHQAGA